MSDAETLRVTTSTGCKIALIVGGVVAGGFLLIQTLYALAFADQLLSGSRWWAGILSAVLGVIGPLAVFISWLLGRRFDIPMVERVVEMEVVAVCAGVVLFVANIALFIVTWVSLY